MRHSAGSGSALWATVQILFRTMGHCSVSALNWIRIGCQVYSHTHVRVSMCTWPCIHMHVAVYPTTSGCVSRSRIWLCVMCMWPCIHVHMAVHPLEHGCVSICMWPCIHVHMAMYPRGHISTCTWACIDVQNLVKLYGPQHRMIDHSAESCELHLNACLNLEKNS